MWKIFAKVFFIVSIYWLRLHFVWPRMAAITLFSGKINNFQIKAICFMDRSGKKICPSEIKFFLKFYLIHSVFLVQAYSFYEFRRIHSRPLVVNTGDFKSLFWFSKCQFWIINILKGNLTKLTNFGMKHRVDCENN